MKICCEIPKCLHDEEDIINDYDFVLFHQYITDPEYRDNYLSKRASKPSRMMILDNSAYEFFINGESFSDERYVEVINELKPDYYIVPDTLMNTTKTLSSFFLWLHKYIPNITPQSKPFFTPQGKTLSNFRECMSVMSEMLDEKDIEGNMCIPFHNDFYIDYFDQNFRYRDNDEFIKEYYGDIEITKDLMYSIARAHMMKTCIVPNHPTYKFHMLGSHHPREGRVYRDIDNIVSFDTSYPVKLAVEGVVYGTEKKKPDIIIDDFYNAHFSQEQREMIVDNIMKMRKDIEG